ncbi:MAG: hypothetical protein QXU11_08080 [Thermoproteota archaeon]
MTCSCKEKIRLALESAKSRGRLFDAEQSRRLDSFRENIMEGARELAARHLYRAGVYFASLDNNLEKRPSSSQIRMALEKRLADMSPLLSSFTGGNIHLIMRQSEAIDSNKLLRGILRQESKAIGLLEGNGLREVEQAEKILTRLDKLKKYLESWRQGVREELRIEVVEITDIHS